VGLRLKDHRLKMTSSGTPGRAHPPKADIGNRKINGAQTPLTILLRVDTNRRFPAKFDRETFKWRPLIENFFGRLKKYRGIAIHYCKTDESFSAFITLVATIIRLK